MVTPPLTRSQRRGDQLQQQPPLVSTTTTTTPPAVPPTTRTTTEKAAVSEPPRGKRQSIKNDNVKAFRRMTLFEQMSVPPPDVRKREISQYMSRHPGATSFVPHKGIPDDVNMLKDRLRRTSLAAPEPTAAAAAVIVSETPTKKRHMAANDDEDDALNKRSKTEQEEGEDGVSSPPPPADAIMRPNVLPTAAVLGESSDTYQTGTLVWVKRKGRPWFPSEIIRPSDRRVPEEVRSKMGGGGVGGRRNTLVWQFRGDRDQRQWVWVSSDEVCKMGVNPMTDEVFYRGKKERHQMEDIQCVRMAYREAFRKKKLKQIIATSSIN
ncbi:hypothetical protein GGF42_004103 [Coemansia sp. RSA 2424]|nr:hypothetical protein GGF42_004103 [Coemansia sp. RSA 2424]